MKPSKTLVASLTALALATAAQAQTKIYITGSTAFRGATNQAIQNLLNGTGTITVASTNSSLGSANAVTWTGGKVNGVNVTIKASFGGSVGGIDVTSNGKSWGFLPDGATGTSNADPSTTTNPSLQELAVPDMTMSDTFQSSTTYTDTQLVNDIVVGVVPFRWVASFGSPAGLDMTPQLAQQLYGAGDMPLAMLSGLASDRTTLRTVNIGGTPTPNTPTRVFALGRNPDSGTRLIAFAESGLGVNATVTQYQATTSGTAVTNHAYYPVETINGIEIAFGNSGYSSGGTLADLLRFNSLTNLGGYYVGYLGTSDATRALSSGTAGAGNAVSLSWNGVDYSPEAVQEGRYTFWGYEHLLYGALTGEKQIFASNLGTEIKNNTANISGIKLDTMHVDRAGDGSLVYQNY